MRESKETTLEAAKCLHSTLSSCTQWAGLGVSIEVIIEQHQAFSRHRNEAAQALQRELRRQDDGFSMILFKQSGSTKVGHLAPYERAREKHQFSMQSRKIPVITCP